MTLDADELAGVVDLFGALTRVELDRALSELAFRHGETAGDVDAAVNAARDSYHLVAFDGESAATGDATLLTVGPVAFPRLPDGAEDLPLILDVEPRQVDRATLAPPVKKRLSADAARAVESNDRGRIATLLDVSYDLEAWAPVDVSSVRERLNTALAEETHRGDEHHEG